MSLPSQASADSSAGASNSVKLGKGQGQAVKYAIAAVLVVAIIVVGVLLVSVMGSQKDQKKLQGLMEQAAEPGTTEILMKGESVSGFLSAVAKPGFDEKKGAVFQALYLAKASDGTNIDKEIVEFATKERLGETVRSKLFEVLDKRNGEDVVSPLLEFATKSKEEEAVFAALNATHEHLDADDLGVLYHIINNSDSDKVRGAAERAAKEYFVKQRNNSVAAKKLVATFKRASKKKSQQAFLRLLGTTGSSEAQEAVRISLSSGSKTIKISAYAALANWTTDDFFDEHFEAASSETEAFLRSHAFDSMISFLKKDSSASGLNAKKMWTMVSQDLRDLREKKEFIKTLAQGSEVWASNLIKPLQADPDESVSFLAERAMEAMEANR